MGIKCEGRPLQSLLFEYNDQDPVAIIWNLFNFDDRRIIILKSRNETVAVVEPGFSSDANLFSYLSVSLSIQSQNHNF